MRNVKSKTKKGVSVSKKIRIIMICFFIALLLLIIRLGFIQFVQGADLREQMYNQLIRSDLIKPKRGSIYDSTGKVLATSAQVDTISINPSDFVVKNGSKIDEEETKALKEKVSKAFSDIFELDYDETLEKVSSDSTYAYIAKKVEKDKVDKLKEWMNEEKIYNGINIDEDTKRYYPYENLASSLIGFCGSDNDGREGIEAAWDDILAGVPR